MYFVKTPPSPSRTVLGLFSESEVGECLRVIRAGKKKKRKLLTLIKTFHVSLKSSSSFVWPHVPFSGIIHIVAICKLFTILCLSAAASEIN